MVIHFGPPVLMLGEGEFSFGKMQIMEIKFLSEDIKIFPRNAVASIRRMENTCEKEGLWCQVTLPVGVSWSVGLFRGRSYGYKLHFQKGREIQFESIFYGGYGTPNFMWERERGAFMCRLRILRGPS